MVSSQSLAPHRLSPVQSRSAICLSLTGQCKGLKKVGVVPGRREGSLKRDVVPALRAVLRK